MPRKRVPYKAGDWIAVPLGESGYAVGKIVQADLKGGVTGYFFGPRRTAVPALADLANLRHDEAVYVGRFGDLGLIKGDWPVIGGHDVPDAREWPAPAFGRLQHPPPRGWRVVYRDDDTTEPASVEPVSVEECLALPDDALDGAGAVQTILTRLLAGLDVYDSRRQALKSWARRGNEAGEGWPRVEEQAVLVHLRYRAGDEEDAEAIEDSLAEAIEVAGVGQLDGAERDLVTGEVVLFTYGPDAAQLAAVVSGVLTRHPVPAGTHLVKRYGGPGERQERIDIL